MTLRRKRIDANRSGNSRTCAAEPEPLGTGRTRNRREVDYAAATEHPSDKPDRSAALHPRGAAHTAPDPSHRRPGEHPESGSSFHLRSERPSAPSRTAHVLKQTRPRPPVRSAASTVVRWCKSSRKAATSSPAPPAPEILRGGR